MTGRSDRPAQRHRHRARPPDARGDGRGRGRRRRLRRGPDRQRARGAGRGAVRPRGGGVRPDRDRWPTRSASACWCRPAGELLCDADAHIVTHEDGGAAQHGGIQTRTVARAGARRRRLLAAAAHRRAGAPVPTSAVAVENTHNRGGGSVHPLDAAARRCDGVTASRGRASTATAPGSGTRTSRPASRWHEYGALFDTALGLPVQGTRRAGRLAGRDVGGARRRRPACIRSRLGGGMRQAGILAAAGPLRARPPPRAAGRGPRPRPAARRGVRRRPGISRYEHCREICPRRAELRSGCPDKRGLSVRGGSGPCSSGYFAGR